MAIVGFNFTKILAEKKNEIKGKVDINNNVNIVDVQDRDLSLGTNKQKAVEFIFEFSSKYNAEAAIISLVGNVIFIDDSKKIKEILDGWMNSKKLPTDITGRVLNTVLDKCNLFALILSERINLPPPVRLPRVEVVEKKNN